MQQGTASPMTTAVTPPLTAITTITNVDNLLASVLLGLFIPGALDGLVTFCGDVVTIEAVGTVVCVLAAV